ncbi:MAG: ABC transporter ATP-binding protein [Calditrichaeota bacterium]|nr:MAG: ABC transporter ATP-binding protein [Calditrichota bacterium]
MEKDEITGKVYDVRLVRRIAAYTKGTRGRVAIAVALIIAVSFLQLLAPWFTKQAIDIYVTQDNLNGLNTIIFWYIVVIVALFALQYFQALTTQFIGQKLMYNLRDHIFGHIQNLSLSFFDKNPVGRLMTRVTSDVESLNQMFTQGVVNIFGDIFLLIGIVTLMLRMNTELALWTFTVIPVLFFITLVFKRKVRLAFREIRKWLARINSYVQENITGMHVVQIFNREEHNFKVFAKINRAHTDAYVRTVSYYAVFYPAIELVSAIALSIVLVRGGLLKAEGLATYGALVAFIQYAQMFFRPISDLSDKFNVLQGAIASAERVFKLLDTRPEIFNPAQPVIPQHVEGHIRFKDVSFAYDNTHYVLENINFEVPPRSSIAIVGHTGAGKTTLINLLGRQYDVQMGRIELDGRDIRAYDLHSLRRNMALVLQDVFLFSGTIAENVSLGNPELSREQIIEACKKVNAHHFIERLPDGYDTRLNERGANLSMGQRQLLSFARAIITDPRIIVLDEATSNIDTETEIWIQDALDKMMRDRTSIIIAHRLSTIKHVDRILVFHKGHLKEDGTHNQLIAQKGLYYRLYQLQFKDQERFTA